MVSRQLYGCACFELLAERISFACTRGGIFGANYGGIFGAKYTKLHKVIDPMKRERATTTLQKHGNMEENPAGRTGSKDAFYLKLSPVLMALRDNERDIET